VARKQVKFEVNPLLQGPSLQARKLTGSPYRELNLDDIDIDPDQPRRLFDEDSLKQLADSIRQHGVMSPILVRLTDGGTYRIISGERRFRASKLLGNLSIPAIIAGEEIDRSEILGKQLVENLQREDLNPLERSIAIGQLRDVHSWSVREIASKVGLSKTGVQRSLEILTLPEDLQQALSHGASESKVLLLGAIEDKSVREKIVENLDSITRLELEALINEIQKGGDSADGEVSHGGTPKKAKGTKTLSVEDQRIVDDIQRSIAAKVHIQRKKGTEQGKLVIEFYTEDDLDKVFKRLTGQ
jgi:ParB family chromosome partitioning protein